MTNYQDIINVDQQVLPVLLVLTLLVLSDVNICVDSCWCELQIFLNKV